MASAREERMQQRLRGAQRRQVKDVDFALTFPAGPDTLQSTQQSVLSQSTSGATVPLSDRGHPGSRRGAAPGTISPENNLPTTRSTTNDANISAKRRKLNSDQGPSSSSARATRSSLRTEAENALPTGTRQHDAIEEGAEQDELEIPAQITSPAVMQKSPLPPPIAEVVMESPAHAPGSGYRTRVSLDASTQSSRLQDSLQGNRPASVAHVNSSPAQKRKGRMGNATPKTTTKRPKHHQGTQVDDSEVDELSPDQPRGQSTNRTQFAPKKSLRVEVDDEDLADHSAEEAEEIDDAEAAVVLKRSRGRGRPSMPTAASPDLDEPTPVAPTKKRGRSSKISTPAQQRQPKPAASQATSKPASQSSKTVKTRMTSKSSKSAQSSTKGSKMRSGSPIPIVVHRFTKRPLYDEDESDADILNSEIPYIKRGGVNAIDVLSQVCHEIIESGLDTLAEGGRNADDSSLRREYKTKWSAVEAFGREVQNRLLEHTINLDNSYALEKRVREERKTRLALREDILRIRAEREQIALRMDDIRIKHEAESKDAQERDSLNNTIHDIELALERGKQQHPHDSVQDSAEATGLELVLKRVASDVSNKSDSGGILKQVKEFNAFLERAAVALEAKRA